MLEPTYAIAGYLHPSTITATIWGGVMGIVCTFSVRDR